MACACNGTSTSELWINVQGNGQPTKAMTKAEAEASRRTNGGYIRRA